MDEVNKRFRAFLKSWYCCLSYSHSVCVTQAFTLQLYLLLLISLYNSLIYCHPTSEFKLLGHANIQLAETKKEKVNFQHRGGEGSIQEKCRRKRRRRRKNICLLLGWKELRSIPYRGQSQENKSNYERHIREERNKRKSGGKEHENWKRERGWKYYKNALSRSCFCRSWVCQAGTEREYQMRSWKCRQLWWNWSANAACIGFILQSSILPWRQQECGLSTTGVPPLHVLPQTSCAPQNPKLPCWPGFLPCCVAKHNF